MNWEIMLDIYWPHDRFSIGWDIIHSDDKYNYSSYILYLGIFTITLDIY